MPGAVGKVIGAMQKWIVVERNHMGGNLDGAIAGLRGASARTKAAGGCLIITDMDCGKLALEVDLAGRIGVKERPAPRLGQVGTHRRKGEAQGARKRASRASRELLGLIGVLPGCTSSQSPAVLEMSYLERTQPRFSSFSSTVRHSSPVVIAET